MRFSFDNLHNTFLRVMSRSGCKAFAEMYMFFYWGVFFETDSPLCILRGCLNLLLYFCFYFLFRNLQRVYIKFSYIASYIFLSFLAFGQPPHSIFNCYEIFGIVLCIPLGFSFVLLWSKEPILCCIADLIILITLALMLFPVITNFKFDILAQNIISLLQEFGIS